MEDAWEPLLYIPVTPIVYDFYLLSPPSCGTWLPEKVLPGTEELKQTKKISKKKKKKWHDTWSVMLSEKDIDQKGKSEMDKGNLI